MPIDVESEWLNATKEVEKALSDNWWAKMHKNYNEVGREAHNLSYLQTKFEEFSAFRPNISNVNAFIIALFFQYFHYDPKDSECSSKNLESFDEFSNDAGIKDGTLYKDVKHLLEASSIYSTEEHKIEGAYGQDDVHYFLDLDLMCFGLDSESYQSHSNHVAKEYEYLDVKMYKNLRQRVLRSFLLIPNIFATKLFRDKYEQQARKNIQTELDNL